MPERRPRGNSCNRGEITQVGLSREVGMGKDFTEDWLALPQEHTPSLEAHQRRRAPPSKSGSARWAVVHTGMCP